VLRLLRGEDLERFSLEFGKRLARG
jgi:hypothetical protein